MITSDVFLRRSLLAPVVVPTLALLGQLKGYWSNSQKVNDQWDAIALGTALFLGFTLAIGGIPYIWMLWDKRRDIRKKQGSRLRSLILQFPLEMIPYFWKFWGILGLVSLVSIVGAAYAMTCASIMFVGTIAVIVLGYIYIGVTFAFQSVFQWFGLVEKGTTK